jgi:hypothetical protein
MINVLRHLHTYIPKTSNGCYNKTGIVRDQLTVECAVNCQLSVTNGFTPDDRLEGMHVEIADWHAEMNFLGVSD